MVSRATVPGHRFSLTFLTTDKHIYGTALAIQTNKVYTNRVAETGHNKLSSSCLYSYAIDLIQFFLYSIIRLISTFYRRQFSAQ